MYFLGEIFKAWTLLICSLKRTETTHDETEDDGSFTMEEQRKQKVRMYYSN